MKFNHTIKIILIFYLIIGQSGCAYYPNEQIKRVKEADVQHLQNCTLVGQVYGTSKFAFLALGIELAKDRAKAQAIEIGATHIAWSEIHSIGLPYAAGKAYYCKQ